jgi:hypothetical protein
LPEYYIKFSINNVVNQPQLLPGTPEKNNIKYKINNINCHIHPSKKLKWWDTEDNYAICTLCKIHGSHSSGKASQHCLVPLEEKYKQSLNSAKISNDSINENREFINEQMKIVNEKINEINNNTSSIETKL